MERQIIIDGELYLSRWYLFGRPGKRTPSTPRLAWLPFTVYLHCFHKSDGDSDLHNHPWDAWSFIVKGRYREIYRAGQAVKERLRRRFSFAKISHDHFHRVEILTPKVWTLFVVGRFVKDWGFWDKSTNKVIPWQAYKK